MKRLIALVILLLMAPASMLAQNSDHPPRGQGYAFLGYGTRGMGLNTGFGGELYAYKGLGMGIEFGTAGLGTSANGNINWIGLGSADFSYHFFPKKVMGKAAPFVTGGLTMFFGQDTDVTQNLTHGYNVGGGVDLFASKHLGARFDVRYYGHGGRILWASYPDLAQLSFTAFRIALTFR